MNVSATLLAAAYLFVFASTIASPASTWCVGASQDLDGLALSSCKRKGDVLVAHYQQPASTSPYATEFDRRHLFVAWSSDIRALTARVGFRQSGQKLKLVETKLAQPPESDQIMLRQVVPTQIKHGHWLVAIEEIQYATQGQTRGYAMKCATAIQRLQGTVRKTAVSECFGYEHEARFLQTLSKVDDA